MNYLDQTTCPADPEAYAAYDFYSCQYNNFQLKNIDVLLISPLKYILWVLISNSTCFRAKVRKIDYSKNEF